MMKIFRFSFMAVSIFILSFGISNAQELFVVAEDVCNTGEGSSIASLYLVDPDTAAAKEIGPIGFDGVGGLAQLGDGRLVASARTGGGQERISILIEINPRTGNGRLIGTIGNQAQGGCGRVNDLTYDPATDTLYGSAIQCGGAPMGNFDLNLITINPNTGEGTIIGSAELDDMAGNALAIDSNGNLIGSGFNFGGPNLRNIVYTVNPNNGIANIISSFDNEDPLFNSGTFNPFNGQFLGTLNFFPETELAALDPDTGTLTTIGQLPDCADGIAFVNPPPRPIPTLSQWGLIAMAGIIGLAGFIAIWKKYAAA